MKTLRSYREPSTEAERIEAAIKRAFRQLLYGPLMRDLAGMGFRLANAKGGSALLEAVRTGRVTFLRGVFRGRFTAAVSRELKSYGATWDRVAKAWRLKLVDLPPDIRMGVSASEARFQETLAAIDRRLQKILPAEIAEKIKSAELFDKALWKTDKGLRKSIANITVLPELTDEQRGQIAQEWGENLDLSIVNFASDEILKLRKMVQENVYSGNRYQTMVRTIQASYGTTAAKAKFLARQETNLLTVALKKQRYLEAGVPEYRWACVAGSPAHPVRPAHAALNGTFHRWDEEPPVTSEPGEPVRRNHAGQDYNCRCNAVPVVR